VAGLEPTNQLNEFGFEIVEESSQEESWEVSKIHHAIFIA